MSEWDFFLSISEYIAELAKRGCRPIKESTIQTYPDRQIPPKTVLRIPPHSADQAEESISRLDCERPRTGFVEYFPDFFEKTVFRNPKTHGKAKFKGELPRKIKWNFQTLSRIISTHIFLWVASWGDITKSLFAKTLLKLTLFNFLHKRRFPQAIES